MNHLQVEVRQRSDLPEDVDEARLLIDGEDLLDIVFGIEREHAHDHRVKRYLGPPSIVALGPSRYLLSEPSGNQNWDDASQFDEGEIAIGGCICGAVGCWPLLMRIEVYDDRVVWRDLYNWQIRDEGADWNWSAIGPFVFDRVDYDRSLGGPATAR